MYIHREDVYDVPMIQESKFPVSLCSTIYAYIEKYLVHFRVHVPDGPSILSSVRSSYSVLSLHDVMRESESICASSVKCVDKKGEEVER